MKAIVYHSYGSPDVLHCEYVEKPSPGDDEVLIRIRAAAANPLDYHLMGGAYIMRLMTGLRKPKPTRPGADLAGEVEAVGRNVTRFQPGDPVFGGVRGAFAEYVCAPENRLALKPANLTFEQAAAIPVAGLTALQGLRDKGRIQPGQKVLINGAAGGVGTFAVQIAKSFGAEVTAVCSTRNVDLVRSIGADHVIDYTRDDFTRSAQRYDLIFDCVGNRPLSACRRVMTPKGTFVAVGARPGGRWIGPLPHLLKVLVSSRFVSQNLVFFIASIGTDDLIVLKELIEANKVTPIIDRRYTLSEAPEAIRYLKEGHARGKVVLTVEHEKAVG
ncbi:MAG: alcohol dehydrogenase [Acidobacteria bacterium 13_1_40CM_65_14]|nr:MAG: alcohol dehydrogenase [Acidobacteria bacterium 13_1_40CM_65_14]OLE78475.1 MAG: alcohol dehydrogenase [Acidobacteria bacterium 13_1_20CM_2_65_9]